MKVGRTNDLDRRLAQHNRASNSIGVWSYHDHWPVRDARAAEGAALSSLVRHRVGAKRELFAMKPTKARRLVRRAIGPWIEGRRGDTRRTALRGALLRIALAAAILCTAVLIVRRPDLVDAAGRGLDWLLMR